MSLHEYYARQGVSVSFRNLQSEVDLARHTHARAAFYADKLKLPPRFFHGLRMAEFGPDTGENALSFAQWGAKLVLAEPNVSAHPAILEYFQKFHLERQLEKLCVDTLERFESETKFDFINAEGFVGSIRPTQKWLGDMDRLLTPCGMFVVSYFERTGAWMEQAVNALRKILSARAELSAAEAAALVMRAKWELIGHTRPFEAWVMDVLDNPFARQRYHLDAPTLMREALDAGFRLHACVPHYQDPLWVGWYKKVLPREEYLARSAVFIARQRMSWVLGEPCFWLGEEKACAEFGALIDASLAAFDAAIDAPESADVAGAMEALARWANAHRQHWLGDAFLSGTWEGLQAMAEAFRHAAQGDKDKVLAFCSSQAWFLHGWGIPVHFAVFRREEA